MNSQLNHLVVQQRHIELVSHVKQARTATRVPLPTQEVPTEPTFFTDINQYGMNTRQLPTSSTCGSSRVRLCSHKPVKRRSCRSR